MSEEIGGEGEECVKDKLSSFKTQGRESWQQKKVHSWSRSSMK